MPTNLIPAFKSWLLMCGWVPITAHTDYFTPHAFTLNDSTLRISREGKLQLMFVNAPYQQQINDWIQAVQSARREKGAT